MNTYRSGASVSDPVTGALLFYTNGNSFWNSKGIMMDSSINGNGTQDVIIIPLKQFRNRFIVFNFTDYYIVDMTAQNGNGAIIETKSFALQTSVNRMTAVKHCLSESYWLITIKGTDFYAYLVHPDGRIDTPVVTPHPTLNSSTYIGDFVSSNKGDKLAITNYSIAVPVIEPQVFDFDKRCGKIAATSTLLPVKSPWDCPHGIAFSPDDRFIYVTYGYLESHLVQYETSNTNNNVLIATSPENFNQIACGPDGKLYITTHISGIPSNKMDVVLYPNQKGNNCQYRENFMRLSGVTNFEVPNIIVNHTGTCSENSGFTLAVDSLTCLNQATTFNFNGDQSGVDSMRWWYNNPTQPALTSPLHNTVHSYNNSGYYQPSAVIYFCNNRDTFHFRTEITAPQNISLGNDTILCPGDSITLGNKTWKGYSQWNTGASTSTLTVRKKGIFGFENNYRGCKVTDTLNLDYHPTLQTLLGDAYYLCEASSDLVELNAGKGFMNYLWHPTNDTTQWIVVNKKGPYFVVVNDFRGCKGDDKTIVEERCDLTVYIPNAFTPNGDGLNDELTISANYAVTVHTQIFTRWGELLYDNSNSIPWDGTYNGKIVPEGLYLTQITVSGFINKLPVTKHYSTLVQLLH